MRLPVVEDDVGSLHALVLGHHGYTNQEIAEKLHLSINSIKTYIRTTSRKIGATSRQQAVTWAIQHGFPIECDQPRDRSRDPSGDDGPDGTGAAAESRS